MFAIVRNGALRSVHKSSKAVAVELGKLDSLAYQANICSVWSKEELKDHGVYRFEEPKVPVGKIESGPKEDSVGEFVVTRKAVWVDDPDYVAPDHLQNAKDAAKVAIKNEAGRRIIEIVPEWKQRNLTAQAAQLAEKGRDNWTEDELASWNAGFALWGKVAYVRSVSDILEAEVDTMALEDFQDKDWTADEEWA